MPARDARGDFALQKTVLADKHPNKLYIRQTIGVRLSDEEERRVAFLIDGSLPKGQWYPLNAPTALHSLEQRRRTEAGHQVP
jgi:hypothetical protein